MVRLISRDRKGPILTPSSIPCLRGLPTLNLTQGCAHGCIYCYIQGYCHYPGPDEVVLFGNTADLVRDELHRKRRLPQRVYFSPSSDAFQYLPAVQDLAYETMAVLLRSGVEVAFLSKGAVADRFVELFAGFPGRVFAQIGITTLDAVLCRRLEPRAASTEQRVRAIARLIGAGVATTARLDPLVPGVTDTDASFHALLGELKEAGTTQVAASYLFLRHPFGASLAAELESLCPGLGGAGEWSYARFRQGTGGRMCDEPYRRERFAALAGIARSYGMALNVCVCKNPWHEGEGCLIAGPGVGVDRVGDPLLPGMA